MSPLATLAIYCVVVMAASLFGGSLPGRIRLSHRNANLVMALVAGVILGIGLFHLLPHAAHAGPLDRALWWMMIGLLAMFLITRTLHGHQHVPDPGHHHEVVDAGHAHHHHPERQRHNWIGLTAGMAIHSMFDGIALAASVSDKHLSNHGGMLIGLGTFAAVALHKPLDAMSITSLIARGGGSKSLCRMVNLLFALIVPVGAAAFLLGVTQFSDRANSIVSAGLAFSAGVFVCIALGDLLPELHFHPRDRLRLSTALVVGVFFTHLIGMLEPAHLHEPYRPDRAHDEAADHSNCDHGDTHDGHDH